MTILYLDTVAGISGDMTLGAFVSAGMPLDVLRSELGKLSLEGVELEASHTVRNGITAVKVDVVIPDHIHHHHRHLSDIVRMIGGSRLSDQVKATSEKIFMEVARAESTVHNVPVEEVHFHEVGALDSIVDIVGAAICLDHFGIERVYSSPVKLGSGGFAETEHGLLPVPGPAAVEILKGYPTILTDIAAELTTPTGAAIVKANSSGILSAEKFIARLVGYGAGTRVLERIPNVLRIMIGDLHVDPAQDEVIVVESNIDDMNPEIYPYVIERLLAQGALDATLAPLIMKKGRPGILISVLTGRKRLDDVLSVLFTETTTLGVRMVPVERRILNRSERIVQTRLGPLRVKAVSWGDRERLIPEYEECRRIAAERGVSLVEVYKIVEAELSPAAGRQ